MLSSNLIFGSHGARHEAHPLENGTATYFEEVGKLHKSISQWKLFMHLDMSGILEETIEIQKGINAMSLLCARALQMRHPLDNCRVNVGIINATLYELNQNNKMLSELITKPSNIVIRNTKLQKYLFGTMDHEDADYINSAIQTLQENDKLFEHNLERQSSVVTGLLDALNQSNLGLNKTVQEINSQIDALYKTLNENLKIEYNFHLFDETFNILSITLERLLDRQTAIFDMVQEAKLGHLDRHLTTSNLVLKALTEIQVELLESQRFPAKPTVNNLALFSKISSVKPVYAKGQLVLEINIPLISDSYTLHKMTAIPQKYHGSSYYYVKLDAEFVAINHEKVHYIYLTKTQFQECIEFTSRMYICQQNFPVYNQNDKNCIISLTLGTLQPSTCEVRIMNITHEIWHPLLKPNTWMYVVPKATSLRIMCNDTIYITTIHDSGTLELDTGCKGKTSEINIETTFISTALKSKFTIYNFGDVFSDLLNELNLHVPITPVKTPKPVNVNGVDLDSLSVSVKDIKDNLKHIHSIPSLNQAHQYSMYVVITVLLIVIVYVLCKKFLRCKMKYNCSNRSPSTA